MNKFFATAALVLTLASTSVLADPVKTPVASPDTCAAKPCVTLDANDLNTVGALLMQNRETLANQYKAVDSVLTKIQKQINPSASAAGATPEKK